MKSFCIKTNNQLIINYLLKNLEASSLENIYYTSKQFKLYKNIIVHYKGLYLDDFLGFLTDILTKSIIIFYEQIIIRKIINFNYFYFDDFEKKQIEKNCYKYMLVCENEIKNKNNEIFTPLLSYINENKSMILDGFVTFRLENYINTLNEVVDYAINQFIVEKEYNEFINLLKLYIDSKLPEIPLVNLVYNNGESILLDENKQIINIEDKIFNVKYLSDISFSSNDYALNALLTLLPQKIEIHLINSQDEFINTLKLIFGNRIYICTDCNICRTYKILNNTKKGSDYNI